MQSVIDTNFLLAMRRYRFYLRGMILRSLCVIFTVMVLVGCPKSDKKPNKGKGQPTAGEQPPTKDQNDDVAFQGFVTRLRKAVASRDVPTLSSMMASDFGYRWDDAPEGETPFAYWDEHNLWGAFRSLVKEEWVPHDGFMVVPAQFARDESYSGYRAGLTMISGGWRLAYFVPAPPATQ